MRVVFFVVLLLPFVIPVLVDDAFAADWYSTSWEYRKKIEISLNTATEVNSDLTDFPVLVSVTDSDFIKAAESDGTDIIFTSSDGTTKLAHEIERYDSSTGEVIAWVKIPTLSASATTDIYIYYKGVEEIDSSSVWDSNYRLVYHLNQTSTGTENEFYDVSDNGNDGTGGGEGSKTNDSGRIPTRVEGKIGYGQSFDGPTQPGWRDDGSGDFIWADTVNNWPGNSGSTSDNDTTVEFWAKVESGQSNIDKMDFFGYSASGNDNEFVLFKINSLNPGVRGNSFDSDVDAATSDWTHLMIVYNPGGIYKIYQDGTLAEESSGTVGSKGQRANGDFVLGAEIDSGAKVNNELQGDLDEFRISYGIRSADWAAASYATQNSPDTYLTISCEENSTTKSCEQVKKGSSCWDCTRPAITNHGVSVTPDGFSINDNVFKNNQKLYNDNPVIEAEVGEIVTIKARAWDNKGPGNIVREIVYLDIYEEKPHWRESEAFIKYDIRKNKFDVSDKNNLFALVGVTSEIVENPYQSDEKLKRPLELLDITFNIIFAKPMKISHIAIQTIDDAANYQLIYFKNALKINEKEILEIPEVPEEVIPEVPEEVIPEPEPPIKEPEPEIILTMTNEKTILSFVDENLPAKHYVKRYITETEYKEWFDVNYSDYKFWEGIGITQERFDELVLEIESEPEPKMIQTGFVLVPDDEKSLPLVEETYEPEPPELELPEPQERKGFFDWLFSLFG